MSKYRPYKNSQELISDHNRKIFKKYSKDIPLIWVKNKYNEIYLIVCYGDSSIGLQFGEVTLKDLYLNYTFIDNSPCGMEDKYESR